MQQRSDNLVGVVQVTQMKYFSTRGGADLITFEEVNRFSSRALNNIHSCPRLRPAGRPRWSRTQWRLVHPRAHTDVTPELARRLVHLLLRRSFCCPALPLHLTGRALARRVTRAREPIVHHHIPTCRHHALDETERQRVHPRAFPRPNVLIQGRGVAAPRQPIRVFPRETKCA